MAANTKLEIWQKDLIDMSRMNNLLHFRSSGRGAGIQFHVPDVNQWFTWFQSHHRPLSLKDVRSNLPPDELERALVRLRARARDDLNDRGINTLYLAFGLLAWREAEHSEEVIRSPLLLVPVTLSRDGSMGTFSLQQFVEEDIEINPTLREKLNHDFRIQLPTFDELEEIFERQSAPTYKQSSNSGGLSLQWIFEQLRKRWPAHPQWVIESSVYLGRFSFQKLVMYQDLIHHHDEILAHPLLLALGGNRAAMPRTTPIQPHQLDQHIHPRDSLEILDADSSQQEAILAAKRGDSFVLQGPPGTGKSQTIANIIAESLGLGRKVLFVSEKMAALEVVQQRLQAANLGDFCLDLHNPKADKKLFIQGIQSALSDSGRYPNPSNQADWNRESEGLFRTREELNLYIREVHLPRFALEQSAFGITGEFAKLEDTPDSDFDIPQIQTINQVRLNTMRQALDNLVECADVLDQYQTHPWRDTLVQTYSLSLEASIRDHFSRFSQELAELQNSLTRIRDGLGEEQAAPTFAWTRYVMECVDRVLQSPRPPRHWLHVDELQRIRMVAKDAAERCANYHTLYAVFSTRYHRSLLQLDHEALLQTLSEKAASIAGGLQPQESTPQDSGIIYRQELDQHLRVTSALLPRVAQAASAVAEASYQQPPTTLEDIALLNHLALLLLNTPNPPEPWLHAHQFSHIRAVALDAGERYSTCAKLRSLLEPLYEPTYFELDLHTLAQRFKEKYQSAFRWLRPQYHQDLKRLKSLLRAGIQRTNAQLEADLYQAVKLLDEERHLREQRLEHSSILGYYFNGDHTDWNQISAAINWTADFHTSFGAAVLSSEMLRIVTGPVQTRTILHTRYQHFAELWEQWGKETEYLSHQLKWEGVLGHSIHLERVEMGDIEAALQQFQAALQAFWQTLDTIAVHRTTSLATLSWAEILEDIHRAAEVASFEAWLHEHQQQLAAALGTSFTGADTDWAALFTMLDWTEEFLRFSPHQQLPEKMAQLLCREGDEAARITMSEVFNAARDCLERVRIEFAYAEEHVLPRHALLPVGRTLEMATPLTVKERVDFFLERLPQLGRWLTCKQRIERCNQQGLGEFITRMLRQRPFPRNIARIFERRFYVLWLDEVRRQSPTLRDLPGITC